MFFTILGYLIPLGLIIIYYQKVILDYFSRRQIEWYGANGKLQGDPKEEKIADLIEGTAQKQLYLLLAIYFSISINHFFGLMPGWYPLIFSGICLSLYIYIDRFKSAEIQLLREQVDQNQFEWLKEKGKQAAIAGLIVIFAISGNWAYQVNKNFNDLKDRGIDEALNLVGDGWCNEFSDINVSNGGETVVKSGGWPCIKIASINNLQFKRGEKDPEMCFEARLDRERGLPGQESFEQAYKFEIVCSPSNWWEGWTSENFTGKLYEQLKIREELSALQSRLCQSYYYQLSNDDKFIYC